MPFQPADTLRSRTYLGLIVAQFLAAFNDQTIHASSMFFAIRRGVLTQEAAISLMPILFFAPWALFCTLAGYLADRYSKRTTLVAWKFAEVAITLVALAGFALPSDLGPYLVLSTVFLMGTHSAFFVPAKYGCLPEILQPTLLSKGNGILESTSFLAVILGTVSGGLLSFAFHNREWYIGLILVGLALVGAAASVLIEKMPAANPTRPFPRNLVKPLWDNLRIMAHSRPLALAVLGIAFFTFMVAYMRATMYMHGESRVPRWLEFKTSLVVATVALGVGLGSPLAGFLSGGKVELGLVPLGAVGMIVATLVAAFTLNATPWLIVCLIVIGFFSGFYIVPLYTLLQHRAPKTSKGDLVATSNFINVTGAIAASLLFFTLEYAAHRTGLAPRLPQEDRPSLSGTLAEEIKFRRGRAEFALVRRGDGHEVRVPPAPGEPEDGDEPLPLHAAGDEVLEVVGRKLAAGEKVKTKTYVLPATRERGWAVTYYRVGPADKAMPAAYDNEQVPRYLFMGASLMTLAILLLLCRQMPDFFVRSLVWVRSLGGVRLRVVGLNNLPAEGPVILATNCDQPEGCLKVLAATDRFTRFILVENGHEDRLPPLLGYLARRTSLAHLRPGGITPEVLERTLASAVRALGRGEMVGLPANGNGAPFPVDQFLHDLLARMRVTVLPVWCGAAVGKAVHVVIGRPLPPETPAALIRREIHALEDWDRVQGGEGAPTARIPGPAGASHSGPAAARPPRP
jgi:MFS family permease